MITPAKNMPNALLAPNALLVFADGAFFFGKGIGKQGTTTGEICFNTSITGYQEILTDPSYTGQIVTFTFPHIGNTGTNKEDIEGNKVAATGLIIRQDITQPSNFRSEQHLNDYLIANNITGICNVDTRAITRYIRQNGAQNVAIAYSDNAADLDVAKLQKLAQGAPDMAGMELAKAAGCKTNFTWDEAGWVMGQGYQTLAPKDAKYHVVALDFGCKKNILRNLASLGCKLTIVPPCTSATEILALNPDGIFLSNGPGDPSATGEYSLPMIRDVAGSGVPVFGICLGHQMLALALGCKTEKMKQGHRGANHPVKDLRTGKVEITSQNHGFVVKRDSIPDTVEETHISLFDNTNEGIRLKGKPVFSVQHHPEASPGPQDSFYLFREFIEEMNKVQSSESRVQKKGATA